MSKETETAEVDYGEMGRNYWIAEEGAVCSDLITANFNELRHFLTTLEEFINKEESHEVTDVENRYPEPIDWSEHYPSHWQDIIGTQLRHPISSPSCRPRVALEGRLSGCGGNSQNATPLPQEQNVRVPQGDAQVSEEHGRVLDTLR